MSAHRDAPGGRQYHVRYQPFDGEDTEYWMSVLDDEDEAQQQAADYRHMGLKARVMVRDVTPWREL